MRRMTRDQMKLLNFFKQVALRIYKDGEKEAKKEEGANTDSKQS